MRIALAPGSDGWNALVSPDGRYVACGRGQVTVVTIGEGVTTLPQRQRAMGWLDNEYLAVQQYEDNCDVLRMYAYTGSYSIISTNQNIQRAAAGHDHWVGGYAADRKVVYDGNLLDIGVDWHCGCDGEWAVILSEQSVVAYRNGLFKATYPHSIVRDYAIVREGYVGIGRNGPPVLIELSTGSTIQAKVGDQPECEPVYSQGWVCTTRERPTPAALVRPLGASDVLELPIPEGAVGCDFRVVGNRGIVASWSDRGQCVIQDCDLTAPRHVLPPTPPTEPPIVIPPIVTPPIVIVPPKPPGLMRGLVAGFDDPISDDRLAWFVSQGVQSVRTGVGKTDAINAEIVAQLAKYPFIKPYYSIRFGALDELNRVPEGAPFEAGNEPNLANITPAKYAYWANSIRGICAANSLTPYWGSISNINRDGLNWLAEVLRLCPWMDHLAIHRYNYGAVPNVGASQWGNRTNEMHELISVIGTRAFRTTEIGCLCGPRCYSTGAWFWKRWYPISEQQQLDYVRAETALWKAMPMCEAVYYYQERSGVPSDYGFDGVYAPGASGAHRKAWGVFRG